MPKWKKLILILKSRVYRRALFLGCAAAVEHEPVLRLLLNHEPKLILDIGANRGQFALVAHRVFPQARLISFEPLAEPAGIFTKVFASDDLVSLHTCAIGPQEQKSAIHISQADDSSSLLPISALQEEIYPGTAERETREIQVYPLSALLTEEDILHPALLKMDIQGYELEALHGCEPLLRLFSTLYIECSFMDLYVGQAKADEIIAYLASFGFGLTGIYNVSYDGSGRAVQGDFMFNRCSAD